MRIGRIAGGALPVAETVTWTLCLLECGGLWLSGSDVLPKRPPPLPYFSAMAQYLDMNMAM